MSVPLQEDKIASKPEAKKVTRLPCRCLESGRNLIVCIDGTSNMFGRKVSQNQLHAGANSNAGSTTFKNTNVVELYSHLIKNNRQLTYYSSGIGTYAKPSYQSWKYWKQVLNHKLDMAIAWCVLDSQHSIDLDSLVAIAGKPGILMNMFSMRTNGCRSNTRTVIVFFYSVSIRLRRDFYMTQGTA